MIGHPTAMVPMCANYVACYNIQGVEEALFFHSSISFFLFPSCAYYNSTMLLAGFNIHLVKEHKSLKEQVNLGFQIYYYLIRICTSFSNQVTKNSEHWKGIAQ